MRHDNTKGFLSTLLLGQEHARPTRKLRPALKNQWYNVVRVWRNTRHDDFGIERWIRLALVWLQYLSIGLYIRHLSGYFGLQKRKLCVEIYVVLKLALPLLFLKLGVTGNQTVAWIAVYMAAETVMYLMTLIFLSNEFAEPISSRRSLATLFLNYVQVCLDYAVVYSHLNIIIPDFFIKKLDKPIEAIYFSFVTSATVGYGDIYPTDDFGKFLVVTQIISFLLFAALFISFFISKVQVADYHITNPRRRTRPWMKANK
jgi:hypothetical protein